MLCTDQTQVPHHAPVDEFTLLNGRLLSGTRLRSVIALQNSIIRYGLLAPIIAVENAGRLIVVDGRKRLAAIRRLAFEGRLPRSLNRIPYLLIQEAHAKGRNVPILISNRELYTAINDQFRTGASIADLAENFYISHQCVRDVLSLSRLHTSIREAVFQRVINFAQARAYATIADQDDQLARLRRLGPFATPAQILNNVPNQAHEREAIAA